MDHVDSPFTADLKAALPRLRRYARILVGGRDGADELVAQTLAGVWRGRRFPPPEIDFLPWLFGLMRATHRHVSSKVQPSGRSDDSGGGVATANMRARVLRLPIEEREVLMLVAVERLSYADIANLLDVPIATVMSTLARARERLCAMECDGPDSSRMA